ncbi:MAG: hypothetical protein A2086_09420 [Spirochaetes bacterium GWD1_27_9]|nr:MAG: hypothetical protein A2Z98_06270 [Spirochaetes bacterium GWB1_27_13]OHD21810.1 MAG: hypothetical protein A2Y34_01805 [Spirochaetes bacterium GWC1_27_15]OHD29800.1 MAG: hypothetical protein A2086_09420 [Spirochaetes bacterium GWD1_27_9]
MKIIYCIILILTLNILAYGKENSIFFPFLNSIYKLNLSNDKFEKIKETSHLFSKNYFYFFDYIILFDQNQKEILAYSLTKKDITPLLKGNISNIYVNNDKLIAISININEKSEFEIIQYSLSQKKNKISITKDKTYYSDIFASDYGIIDNLFFISGVDSTNSYSKIMAIDLTKKEINEFYKTKNSNDFIKIIPSETNFIFYLSQSKYKEDSNNSIWFSTTQPNKLSNKNLSIKNLSFYGKGFTKDNNYYIPAIDKSNSTYIIKFELKNIEKPSIIPIDTGIYHLIYKSQDKSYFIGYNYYKSNNKFYFVIFNNTTYKSQSILINGE